MGPRRITLRNPGVYDVIFTTLQECELSNPPGNWGYARPHEPFGSTSTLNPLEGLVLPPWPAMDISWV